jgi:hypothetical protein
MTTRVRVTYFQGGRSKPRWRLILAFESSLSVAESRQEIQKALSSMADSTVSVKSLWTREGFLLPDKYEIGVLVDADDEIYATDKPNVAPQLSSSGSGGGGSTAGASGAGASSAAASSGATKGVKRELDVSPDVKPAAAAGKSAAGSGEPKVKKPRAATAYNLYMKDAMPLWKVENPDKTHKEAFAACAGAWRNSSANPKNGGVAPNAAASTPAPPAIKKEEEDDVDDMDDSDAESGVHAQPRLP